MNRRVSLPALLRLASNRLRAVFVRLGAARRQGSGNLGTVDEMLLYRGLFENTQDAVCIISLDGRHLKLNQRAVDLLGYSEAELVGQPLWPIVAPDEQAQARAVFESVLAGESIPLYERTFVRKDGSTFPAEVNIALVRDSDGRPAHIQSIIRDITQRKRTETALADRNELLHTLINSVPDFVYIKDRDSRFIMNNAAHARALNATPEQCVGKTDFDFFPHEMAAKFFADEQAIIRTGEPMINYEEPVFADEGRIAWVLTTKVPLRDSAGEITGIVGVTRDITGLRAREQALIEKERFVSHITQTAPDILYVYDRIEDRYIYMNHDIVNQVLGYSDDEIDALNAQTLVAFMHPDDWAAMAEWTTRFDAASDDEIIETEYRLRHNDGSWRWLHSRDRVFARDENGWPYRSLGVAQDVTERKVAEQQLYRQNEYLRALSEITPALMNRLDPGDLLKALLARAAALADTEHGFIDLVVPGKDVMVEFASLGYFEGYEYEVRRGEGAVGMVWETGETLVIPDYAVWPHRLPNENVERLHASICLPLKSGDQVVGVLGLDHLEPGRDFSDDTITLLTRVAELASIALDNARLYAAAQEELAERKRTEDALRQSEERYRAVIDDQTELIARFTPDTTITFVNDAYCRFFGKSREELIGKSFMWHVPEEDQPKIWAYMRHLAEEARALTAEHRVRMADGEIRWLQFSDRAIYDANGTLVEYQTVARDITELKRMQQELQAERDFVAAILSNVVALATVTDVEGRIVTFNRACQEMTGYTLAEVEGKAIWDLLIIPEELDQVKSVFQSISEGQFPNQNVNHWRMRDGSLRLIEWSNTALTDSNGKVTHVISTGIDITSRKQLEERSVELAVEREKVKILGNFIRDASHDFRTPLSILNTNLYLMKRTLDGDAQTARIQEMERQVVHLTELIDQLLTMTRLDSMPEQHLSRFHLNDLVQDLRTAHSTAASRQGLQLRLELAPELPVIEADNQQLSQALSNIIANALRFTPEGGSVTLRTFDDNDYVGVEIRDTGTGIAPEDLPHIFDRFYRADKARSNHVGGTGLGLSIARKIVELHRGTIEVESAPGEGSVFRVRLPVPVLQPSTTPG